MPFFSDPRSVVRRVGFILRLLWTTLGWRGWGGGGVHEFEPMYSFVEIIFSLPLILMRVLIRITPLYSSGIRYVDRYRYMTKIDEIYMDIKPQTNMHISESWRVYRHDSLFIKVYNTFRHTFGCDTHLFNINLLSKLSDVFGVTFQ